MYKVTKRMTFEAAHYLNLDYESPCKHLHGHSYKVELTVATSELNKYGFVMDFSDLKPIKQWLDENWDHAIILVPGQHSDMDNKIFYMQGYNNVSAENMCKFLADITIDMIKNMTEPNILDNNSSYELTVKIFETENNSSQYTAIVVAE